MKEKRKHQGYPPPHNPGRRSADRTPWLWGCLGMGVGLPLAGLALVLLALWPAVGSKLPPPPAPDPNRADIVITLHEAYFGRAIKQALPAGMKPGTVRADIRPGGLIAIEGNLSADLWGQQVTNVNVRLVAQLTAVNGQVQVQFVEVNLGNDPLLSTVASSLVSGLETKLSQEINRQLAAGLGQNIWIMDVQSDETRLVMQARWR